MSNDDDPLLGDYLERWLQRRRSQIRPTTLDGYRRAVHNHLRPRLGTVRLSELDRRQIERVYGQLLEVGGARGPLAPRSVQRIHAILRRALADAQLDGLLQDNPAEHARTPSPDAGATEIDDQLQVWTFAQVAEFLAGVDDHPQRGLWHLAVGTGARRGELVGLRWQDIDLASATLTIRRSLSVVESTARLLGTKSARSRRLAIGPSVVEALDRHRRGQQTSRRQAGHDWENRWNLVFTEPCGRYIHPDTLSGRYRRLVQSLDVPPIRFHDLRHTHASLLLELRVPIKVISDRLGHASITTTMDTYTHLMPAMDRDAAETLAEALHFPDS